jgi:hypothetical protein
MKITWDVEGVKDERKKSIEKIKVLNTNQVQGYLGSILEKLLFTKNFMKLY